MEKIFYEICNVFCAFPIWKQAFIAMICVMITSGAIYLILWGVKALIYKAAEGVGIILDADYEPYESWMDSEKWEK